VENKCIVRTFIICMFHQILLGQWTQCPT
jgi:hypothetical protein